MLTEFWNKTADKKIEEIEGNSNLSSFWLGFEKQAIDPVSLLLGGFGVGASLPAAQLLWSKLQKTRQLLGRQASLKYKGEIQTPLTWSEKFLGVSPHKLEEEMIPKSEIAKLEKYIGGMEKEREAGKSYLPLGLAAGLGGLGTYALTGGGGDSTRVTRF